MINVQTGVKTKLLTQLNANAIILYPSLGSPAIVGRNNTLFLLLLGKNEDTINHETINQRIKIFSWNEKFIAIKNAMMRHKLVDLINSPDFAKERAIFQTPLFKEPDQTANKIKCSHYERPHEDIFFRSPIANLILDEKIIEFYKFLGFCKFYSITIDIGEIIEEGFYNICWTNISLAGSNPFIIEIEDRIIRQKMPFILGKKICPVGDSYYGFRLQKNEVFFDQVDPESPICSYHPFYYKRKKYLNCVHMTDLHISSRQFIIQRSTIKVIDHSTIETLGDLINVTYSNVFNLFEKIGKLSKQKKIDFVCITGDIIDFIKNFFPASELSLGYLDLIQKENKDKTPEKRWYESYLSVHRIWDAVGFKSEDEVSGSYHDSIDFIIFYSLLISFLNKYNIPVILVSGNHEAYYDPYGISPRISGINANPEIPRELNLTTYEAILLFGESYHEVEVKKQLCPEYFELFYSLFTPVRDFALTFPDFTLSGLSWGDSEDIFMDLGGIDLQGRSHLPRADSNITKEQFEIIRTALKEKKKCNLIFSHYTFLCDMPTIPSHPFGEEHETLLLYRAGNRMLYSFDKHSWGCFESSRPDIFSELKESGGGTVIFSGHTHRHGFYELLSVNKSLDSGMSLTVQNLKFGDLSKKTGPLFIVSDSAGPLPNYNYNNEFSGFGSNYPSCTILNYNSNGEPETLEIISSNASKCKPRVAVALDYMYIMKKIDIIDSFRSANYEGNALPSSLDFIIQLHDAFKHLLTIKKISLFVNIAHTGKNKFEHIQGYDIFENDNKIVTTLSFAQIQKIESYLYSQGIVFISIIFKLKANEKNLHQMEHYNYDSAYNFKIKIFKETRSSKDQIIKNNLIIKRDSERIEIPDFEYYKALYSDNNSRSDSQQEYIIIEGDTLSGIAKRFSLSWQQLYQFKGETKIANSERLRSGSPDRIYPGEKIIVPNKSKIN